MPIFGFTGIFWTQLDNAQEEIFHKYYGRLAESHRFLLSYGDSYQLKEIQQ